MEMLASPPVRPPEPALRLLVELPSRRRAFFGNLRDLVFPRRLPPLELRSAPAPFWHDVFVRRGLPWFSLAESIAYHVIALALLVAVSRYLVSHPPPVAKSVFDHEQVVYYSPSEYLPPLDTRSAESDQPKKSDPEVARQPIISVPREANNRSQTIVAPPKVALTRDVAMPNVVAWSDRAVRPQLEIPAAPLTPAAEIQRLTPQLQTSVVAPPPDANRRALRSAVSLETSVVAPPPDVHASRGPGLPALGTSVIAPPPSVQSTRRLPLGDLNIGQSAVIAPAPQLPVVAQRTLPGGGGAGLASPQVVPPPPSVAAGGSAGATGRVIALNLHPTVGAPPDPPAGNRRGAFAATPEGHAGASGSPGSSKTATATGAEGHSGAGSGAGNGSGRKGANDLPSGLYVGNAPAGAKTAAVAGDPAAKMHSTATVTASVSPPRVATASSTKADSSAKLAEVERAVFGDRRFYSLTLNMPNLNSAGGSWVIRFAEQHSDPRAPAEDLTQPTATKKVDPGYPIQLIRENVAGTVILYGIIHADGTVGDVRVLRGVDDRLDQFASQAIAQWQFQPATRNGVPVDVEATFHIPFHPPKVGTNF